MGPTRYRRAAACSPYAGVTEHSVALARLARGATVDEVRRAPAGPSQLYEVVSGTAGLAHGEQNWLHIDLTPGDYVVMCFVEDPQTHREHRELGMLRPITVVRG